MGIDRALCFQKMCIRDRGAPIGTNKGLQTRDFLRIIIEQANIPVVVDAGIGAPSHAAEADVYKRQVFGHSSLESLQIKTRIPIFPHRSEEHTSELQSPLIISYAVFCYGESAKNYRDLYPDEEGTLLMPCLLYTSGVLHDVRTELLCDAVVERIKKEINGN